MRHRRDGAGRLGRPAQLNTPGAGGTLALIACVDTEVLIRRPTGEPPDQAKRATEALAAG